MPAWVAPAIGAVASIASGLLSKPKTPKAPDASYTKSIVRNAQKAGFNPLTLLRAGAGQGYSTGGVAPPALSPFAHIASGVAQFAQDYARLDPIGQETKELENELLRIEIEQLQKTPTSSTGPGQVKAGPGYGVPTVRTTTPSPAQAGAIPLAAAAPASSDPLDSQIVLGPDGNPIEIEIEGGSAAQRGNLGGWLGDMAAKNTMPDSVYAARAAYDERIANAKSGPEKARLLREREQAIKFARQIWNQDLTPPPLARVPVNTQGAAAYGRTRHQTWSTP